MKICISYDELKARGLKVNFKGVEQIMNNEMPEMDFAYLADYAPLEYDDANRQVFIALPPIDGDPFI
jgi:hypothetical protein